MRAIDRLLTQLRLSRTSSVRIPFCCFRNGNEVASVAQALHSSEYSDEITLDFTTFFGEQEDDHTVLNWNPLVRELETRVKLQKVEMRGTPPARILPLRRTLLAALQRNPNMKWLKVHHIDLQTDVLEGITSFLDGAPALTTLSLSGLFFVNGINPHRARSIAAALQRNNRIQTLHLDICGDAILCPIFHDLASSDSVSALTKLTCDFSADRQSKTSAEAFQQYLESTSATIQCLELKWIRFDNFLGLPNILRGLSRNTSVNDLAFDRCFCNKEVARQLANVVRNKSGLTTLRFSDCNFWLYQEFLDALEEVLLRHVNSLRCLGITFHRPLYLRPMFPLRTLRAILVVASRSTRLERFIMQGINPQYDDILRALAEGIPLLKIEELELSFVSRCLDENEQDERLVLEAFKRNYSLQSAQCTLGDENWFSEANQARLEFYLDRNRKLVQWTENPMLVPRDLWSYAIMLALKAGANSLYQSLLTLSDQGLGLKRGRKRKRPQYYKP